MTKLRRARDLEARLEEWGREYGGGKYEATGYGNSSLASMVKWGGRPPTGLGFTPTNTLADEVQAVVSALAKQGQHGWRIAEVIRCEYWCPAQPVESKRQKLRGVGISVERVRYLQLLREAKIYVAGRIGVAFFGEDEAAA